MSLSAVLFHHNLHHRPQRHHRSRKSKNESRFSSDEGDSEDEVTGQRHKSPPLPKLPYFDGKHSDWRSIIFQFRRYAKNSHWSSERKLQRLITCLRGKAVDYIDSCDPSVLRSYTSLRDTLDARYNITELPVTARRQLLVMSQNEGESLEDYLDGSHGDETAFAVFGMVCLPAVLSLVVSFDEKLRHEEQVHACARTHTLSNIAWTRRVTASRRHQNAI